MQCSYVSKQPRQSSGLQIFLSVKNQIIPPGSEGSRCYWSNPDAEQLRPYLHSSQCWILTCVHPLNSDVANVLCHAQTNTSWASINHQISSPAVHVCASEMESVSSEQPSSLVEHFHYVSLNKLLPPVLLTLFFPHSLTPYAQTLQ